MLAQASMKFFSAISHVHMNGIACGIEKLILHEIFAFTHQKANTVLRQMCLTPVDIHWEFSANI